jgi:hypothetical protein
VRADPDTALKNYDAERDALHAGRKPRPDTEAVMVSDVINALLNHSLRVACHHSRR